MNDDRQGWSDPPDPPREGGLAPVLWLLAALIAEIEGFAWAFGHLIGH
ncbi:MAG TPA: hypothetical protein VFA66_06655 [Gaiellaceae bacterium]|nr:hypothetical protein [Gaiellaceae bacterium]